MSTWEFIPQHDRAANGSLFAHRFTNPHLFVDPADMVALVDNVSEILDHACAMAKTLYAGATLVGAELDPQDLKHAAWALAHQIQDAQALLDVWQEARTKGVPDNHR